MFHIADKTGLEKAGENVLLTETQFGRMKIFIDLIL